MYDVIIPVCPGHRQTRRSIESALAARCDSAHEIVVIDDASPDPGLSAWLREIEVAGRIRLIAHPGERGFAVSVNEAMRLHPDRGIVLLGSLAEVADGWLDRLVACVCREAGAGTASPFSASATICGYRHAGEPNLLPADTTVRELDRLFATVNAGVSVDIPAADGGCMLITRKCLDAVGYFDEEAAAQGGGGMVDFCLRASRAGWRHLLCCDTFVAGEGEDSFPGKGGGRHLDERYPEFQPRLREFRERDPARPHRRSVDLARIRSSPLPRVLFVSHHWGGGVHKHVCALAELLADDCESLLLMPTEGGNLTLRWLRRGEEFQAWFERDREAGQLLALLGELAFSRVHFHHLHGLPRHVLDLPARLSVPYDFTLHDFMSYCPQYHLADERGRYCGEPDEQGCNACVQRRPAQWGLDIRSWRSLFGALLGGAGRVIAPSQDLAGRVRARFPGLDVVEWPHFETEATADPAPAHRIGVLGGISLVKGLDTLEACARDALQRQLPLHFRVIGHVGRPLDTWPMAPLSITGTYPDDRLDELLSLERLDAVLFLSQVPESYSYTLTVAMRSGLPVVAPAFGAFVERLRDYPRGMQYPWDSGPAAINDLVLAFLGPAAQGQTS